MRVAIYTRVSTDMQSDDMQLTELKRFIDDNNWKLERSYSDKVSGANPNRPGFQQMMLAASQKKFDIVLFWSLDRFSREGMLTTLNRLNELESYGVQYRSYSEAYLDSTGPFKQVVISIMSTIAKMERERIAERIKAGVAESRRKNPNKKWGKKSLDAKLIGQVRELRSKNFSLNAISKQLGISKSSVVKYIKA